MRDGLTEDQAATVLYIIERGILAARLAARSGDAGAAWAVTDLIHNLPGVLRGEHNIEHWLDVDLAGHAERHMDLDGVRQIVLLAYRLRRTTSLPPEGP